MAPRATAALAALALVAVGAATASAQTTGNVVFIHPDGMGVNHWGAVRMYAVGPDGRLNWDRLPGIAVYTGHMRDALTGTSHGGATVHAYGVKVPADSYGMDGTRPLVAASGKPMSILREAQQAGLAVGLINSGTITEPGTGAFVASVDDRYDHERIALAVLEAEPDVILGGGERYFLPRGVIGVHGEGARSDGVDLTARARAMGYTVVFTRDELLRIPAGTERLLGLFAPHHTFNDRSEEELTRSGLPLYRANAPSVAEMARAALAVLAAKPGNFLLVVEEEGTDNMANANNASGTLEAGRRADESIGLVRGFIEEEDPATMLLVASDSDAGGMQLRGPPPGSAISRGARLPERARNGAPLDGVFGTDRQAFESAPDQNGKRWPFAVVWSSRDDVSGGILIRAAGLNSELVTGTQDNTAIYRFMYRTLFGVDLGAGS